MEDVPSWVAQEIRDTWHHSKGKGQMEAYRILERMIDRLGYGRRENNPSLVPNYVDPDRKKPVPPPDKIIREGNAKPEPAPSD